MLAGFFLNDAQFIYTRNIIGFIPSVCLAMPNLLKVFLCIISKYKKNVNPPITKNNKSGLLTGPPTHKASVAKGETTKI